MAENDHDRMPDREVARIWDRLGSTMGAAGELGEVIAQRNLDLWSRIASNLRNPKYTGGDLAEDAAHAATTAVRNLRDVWTVMASPPVGPGYAPALPSRSLFLQPDPSSPPKKGRAWWGYMVSEAVPAIPVPPAVVEARSIVTVRLAGPDTRTVGCLEAFLKPAYSSTDQSVALVPQDVPRLTEERRLQPGVYQGIVYVDADTTPQAIAHLWIVVEPQPA